MIQRALGWLCLPAIAVAFAVASSEESRALPAPGPLQFISPSPTNGSVVTAGSVLVKLDAACNFDTGTLAVSLSGTPIPAAGFLPFSACTNNRITSQTVNVVLTLPNGTISGAPSELSITDLSSPPSANFSGSGNGDQLRWNFDGGAEPKIGSPVSATFNAAGTFTVRLQAASDEHLDASGLSGGNLVTAQRTFEAGDPTPDSRVVKVKIDANLDFENFESGQVHPVALSAAGDQLYAIDTPNDSLSIFDVEADGSLTFAARVPVGLDPVSLAVRPGTSEVWVTNHLSDSVSIVDVTAHKLVETIAAGDEPTDIVFASGRAFVALAANQDRVKVYNASTRAEIASLSIFGDDPRALATNASGTEVYLVVMESGNKSTTLFHDLVTAGGGPPAPNPPRAGGLGPAPEVGLIVKFNSSNNRWEDESGKNWTNFVKFTIADNDIFVIDADAATPSITSTIDDVGTMLFDIQVKPGSGELWVPNTEARNLVRFEPKLRGHLVDTRMSRVNAGTGAVTPVNLNSHINYAVTPGSAQEIADSIAHPGDGVFNAAGNKFYLTALGSRKVAVLDGNAAVIDLIDVGEGPSGVALNEADARLYVLNRFSNSISIVDTTTNTAVGTIGVAGPSEFDPSPDVIKVGRKFLYDAQLTSGHGDTACATCHILGNFDNLAWDLGDPQGSFVNYSQAPWAQFFLLGPSESGFDPMKGPMTTQTLRGLEGLEPFHWRGDRQNFQHFNGAFVNLMGMNGFCEVSMAACSPTSACPSGQKCLGLTPSDMDAYTAFIMTVKFPPNPFRLLNNTVPTSILVPDNVPPIGAPVAANAVNGQGAYSSQLFDAGALSCNNCHALPTGTNTNLFNGNAEGESQDFKIPQLRNMYEKTGFDVIRPGLQSGNANLASGQSSLMKRGFGFLHDGSLSLTEFLAAGVFNMSDTQEREMFAFMMSFPTGTAPCVGWQLTVNSANAGDTNVALTITALTNRAEANECDVIAKGVIGGVAKGFAYDTASNLMVPDSLLESPLSASALRASVAGADVVTFTGVPRGAGIRLGIDRDRDTFLDRTETALGYDPADPNDNPWRFN